MDPGSEFITPQKNRTLDSTYAWSCFKTPITPVIFSSSDEDEQDENVPLTDIVANLQKHATGKGNTCAPNDSKSRKKSNSFVTDVEVLKLTFDLDDQLHVECGKDQFVEPTTPKCKLFRRIVPYSDDEDESTPPCSPVQVFGSSPKLSAVLKESHTAVKSLPDTDTECIISGAVEKFATPTPRKLKPIVLLSDEEESSLSRSYPLLEPNSTVSKSPPATHSETIVLEAASKLVTPTPRKLKPIIILSDDEESPQSTLLLTPNSIFPVLSNQDIKNLGDLKKFNSVSPNPSSPKLKPDLGRSPLSENQADVSSIFPQSDTKKKLSFLKSLSPAASPSIADPVGLKYCKNYRWVKEHLAHKLYKLYNEKVFGNNLPKDLSLEWNPLLTSTAGYFRRSRKDGEKICLSSKVLTSADRLRDTLLHEMCHAAVHFIDKKQQDKHGPIWQAWATRCKIAFPEIPMPTRCHNYSLNYRYKFACTGCGVTFGKQRLKLSFDITSKRCKHCKSKFKQLFT